MRSITAILLNDYNLIEYQKEVLPDGDIPF